MKRSSSERVERILFAKLDSLHHLALIHHTAVRRLIEWDPRTEKNKMAAAGQPIYTYRMCIEIIRSEKETFWNEMTADGEISSKFQKFSRKKFLSSFPLTKHAKWADIRGIVCCNVDQLGTYSIGPLQTNHFRAKSAKIDSVKSDLVYILLLCPVRALRHFINFQFQIVGLFLYSFFAQASAFLSWCGYWIYVFSRHSTRDYGMW